MYQNLQNKKKINDNDNLIDKETKIYLNLISNLNSKQINFDFNAFKNLYQNIENI